MPQPLSDSFSPAETARYTLEMLESLRKIAVRQRQGLLAHLLDLASAEARIQTRECEAIHPGSVPQETELPG